MSTLTSRTAERAGRDGEQDRTERFARFVEPNLDLVARVARRYSNSARDAEDLAQESLLRAFRGIAGFDGSYPRAWLATIVRNTAINRSRRRRDEVPGDVQELLEYVGPATESPEHTVMDQMLDGPIQAAVADLPPVFREVVEAVDVFGLSYQEAAELLDVPIGTVMSRLHRARNRLRDSLVALQAEAWLREQDATPDRRESCAGCPA